MHGLELAQVWNLIWCIIFIHEESVKTLLDRVSWVCKSNVQEVMFKWCSAGSK